MLPYTPLHHLLFRQGAPGVLVMTSANRSSEPIAYADADAFERLSGIADAFLAGERAIARRVDDSVAAVGPYGPVVLRHARGGAPAAIARLPTRRPTLCTGADLKNAVTLVVDGQAFTSQHIGDLDHYGSFAAFKETIADLCTMYDVPMGELLVVHDAHPEYASTQYARTLPGEHRAIQHHRAHVASVLVEREAFDTPVAGIAFDGTGYGDDGTIWGGEIFTGSLSEGLTRAVWLREAKLPGGDAAARYPVQAAAGFLSAARRSARSHRCALRLPGTLHQSEAVSRKRPSYIHHDVGWPALRHGGGAAGLYASHYVRRAGGDVGRASRLVRGKRR